MHPPRVILFVKADGMAEAARDLFGARATTKIIRGHRRGSTYVKPYVAVRRESVAPPPPQVTLDATLTAEMPGLAEAMNDMARRLLPGIRIEVYSIANGAESFAHIDTTEPGVNFGYDIKDVVRPRADGQPTFKIMLNRNSAMGSRPVPSILHSAMHELGHAYMGVRYNAAPAETQAEIFAQFRRETGGRPADAESGELSTRPQMHDHAAAFRLRQWLSIPEHADAIESRHPEGTVRQASVSGAYYRQFEEWFAERFARWAVDPTLDGSPITRLFAAAAEALTAAWRRALSMLGVTDATGAPFEAMLNRDWRAGAAAEVKPTAQLLLFKAAP